MASNTDNQMTRFLFAILKQKNLKDIDWNAVAHDPILSQPITNGHAARMRYSRFRSAMLGLEPQKRNRPAGSKNRVSKPKKDQKPKKDEDAVKPEPGVGDNLSYSNFTPTSMASPAMPDCQSSLHARMLTPCSDDMMSTTQGLAFSPSLASTTAFDLSPVGHCGHDHGHHDHGHEHGSWNSTPIYSAFDVAYGIDGYEVGAMCDHQHDHLDDVNDHSSMVDAGAGQVDVKNEHWDTQYHSHE